MLHWNPLKYIKVVVISSLTYFRYYCIPNILRKILKKLILQYEKENLQLTNLWPVK